jgi:hypothetical protein
MKKFGFLLLLIAVAVMLGGTALAQPGDTDYYFTTYFSGNAAPAPDATLRIINDGVTSGTIYANIFVFDDSEELTQCCSCAITPDGLLSENVRLNLTANSLTGTKPTRGVIDVIAGSSFAPVHGSTIVPPFITPAVGLHGWMTHIQPTKVTLTPGMPVVPTVTGPYFVTETPLADANPNPAELDYIQTLCAFDIMLSGSPCTCQPEDNDY